MRIVPVVGLLLAAASGAAAQMPAPISTRASFLAQREGFRPASIDDASWRAALDSVEARAARSGFRPIRTQEEASAFWVRGETQFLSSGTLSFNGDANQSTLELISDVIGIFRVGVGVTVASAKGDGDEADPQAAEDAEATAALSRLADSGGIFNMTAAVPLLYRTRPAFNSTWALVWNSVAAGEAPKEGRFLEDPAVTFQSGLEFMYERQGVNGRINFQMGFVARGYWYNDAYAAKVDLSDDLGALITGRVGLTLLDRTRVEVHRRLLRTDDFDALGSIAISVQQTTR